MDQETGPSLASTWFYKTFRVLEPNSGAGLAKTSWIFSFPGGKIAPRRAMLKTSSAGGAGYPQPYEARAVQYQGAIP